MNEPKSHTLEAPGAVLHYDVREGAEPTLLLIGSPMAAPGFTTLAAPLRRPHASSPTTRAAPSAASAPTAPPRPPRKSTPTTSAASSKRSADRSTCSPAAAARSTPSHWSPATPSWSAPSSPTSRRPAPRCPKRDGPGRSQGHPRDLPGLRLRRGHGEVHRTRLPPGPVTAAYRRSPPPDPAAFGLPDRGRRRPRRRAAGAEHGHLHRLPARLRRAACGLDPHRLAVGVGADRARSPAARTTDVAEELGTAPVAFPATTAASSAASTARPASPRSSRPSSLRCSNTERPSRDPRSRDEAPHPAAGARRARGPDRGARGSRRTRGTGHGVPAKI